MTQLDDKIFIISQPYLTDRLIYFLNINVNDHNVETNAKSTPVGKPLLHKDISGKPRKEIWNYCTAVGIMTYLQGNIRPEMSMAVHQNTRFCNNPMILHEK